MKQLVKSGARLWRALRRKTAPSRRFGALMAVLAAAALGYAALQAGQAATYVADSEAETGQTAGNATTVQDSGASGGSAVRFGGTESYARHMIVRGLADPEIYKENDDLFFLSGTAASGFMDIYKSTDLKTFTPYKQYHPNRLDSAYTYCLMWAPELIKRGNLYYFYFSAERVNKGQFCPADNIEPTTFFATATDTNLDFGKPQMLNPNSSHPRTYPPAGCPSNGCDRAVRIDSSVFYDGSRYWLHYVWFNPGKGNYISAFPMDSPSSLFSVASPTGAAEEGVNEAPTIFSRNGKLYLFYSTGHYKGAYAMHYIMGNTVRELTRSKPSLRHSTPMRAGSRLLETHGHNSIVERAGRFYNVFHTAEFNSAGSFTGRSSHIQPIAFKADGTIHSLNTVALRWTGSSGHSYSLDVRLRDGTWVTNCFGTDVIGTATSITYNDICRSVAYRIVRKGDIDALRINHIRNGATTKTSEVPYDGFSDSIAL